MQQSSLIFGLAAFVTVALLLWLAMRSPEFIGFVKALGWVVFGIVLIAILAGAYQALYPGH